MDEKYPVMESHLSGFLLRVIGRANRYKQSVKGDLGSYCLEAKMMSVGSDISSVIMSYVICC